MVPVHQAEAQAADSLRNVHRLYVGSLGAYNGSDELRRELTRDLKKSGVFELVATPAQCDAVVEGRGELWTRGYHSLSPRARKNSDYAEPLLSGYLSIRLRGKDDEILWSYFADPPRVSIHELRRDLANEVVSRLKAEHNEDNTALAPVQNGNDAQTALHGGGATFPFPLYQEWFKSFHGRHPAWTFSYVPNGSEQGAMDLAGGKLDFAGSDIAPGALPESIQRDNVFLPSVAGGVVLIYNLPRFTGELHLTAEVIADIFSGKILVWNDPRIVQLNSSSALPKEPIQVFHRADGSGTTFAFTDYLSKVYPAWNHGASGGARVHWTVGAGINGNDELSTAVAGKPYSIGYTEFIYAFNHHLSFASVRNQSGRFVMPDLLSIMAAANWAGDKPETLSLSIVNSPEPSAYPISTLTWLVLPRVLSPEKKTAMTAFLDWMLTSGQRQCSGLGYAPLPRNVVDREMGAVRKLQ